MEPKSSSDAFGPFLETLQQSKKQTSKSRKSANIPIDLLVLLKEEGSVSVSEIFENSDVGLFEVTNALKELQDADLLRISGPSGQESVELTPTGDKLAMLAKSK
jgi:predicted transcriptional regulator